MKRWMTIFTMVVACSAAVRAEDLVCFADPAVVDMGACERSQ